MNKNVALTVVGVILLGLVLVVYNEYSHTDPKPVEITSETVEQSKEQENTEQAKEADSAEEAPLALAPKDNEEWSDNTPIAPETPSPFDKPQNSSATLTIPTAPPAEAKETAPTTPIAPPVSEQVSEQAPEQVTPQAEEQPVTQVAEVKEEEVKPVVPEAPKEAEKPVEQEKPAPPKEASKPQGQVIDKISVLSIGDGVTVRIDSNTTPKYKYMQLKSPDRIVVDLAGDWEVKAPGVPKNEFVKNVRIGDQKDGKRIVIDLIKKPSSIRYLKYGETGLDVRIR